MELGLIFHNKTLYFDEIQVQICIQRKQTHIFAALTVVK